MELTASYLTLAGARFSEPTRHPITERSRVAAATGYAAIGAAACEADPGTDLSRVAAGLHAPVRELEWHDLAAPSRREEAMLLKMADAFGADRVNVGVCQQEPVHHARVVHELRRFAELAGEHGLMVCVEPVAFGYLWNPARVMDLITGADMPNVGYLYDTWQEHRATMLGALYRVPGYVVSEVQLAGMGEATSDCFGDAMDRRGMPDAYAGQSLVELIRTGFTGPVSVEVASTSLRGMACQSAAEITYGACRAVLPAAA